MVKKSVLILLGLGIFTIMLFQTYALELMAFNPDMNSGFFFDYLSFYNCFNSSYTNSYNDSLGITFSGLQTLKSNCTSYESDTLRGYSTPITKYKYTNEFGDDFYQFNDSKEVIVFIRYLIKDSTNIDLSNTPKLRVSSSNIDLTANLDFTANQWHTQNITFISPDNSDIYSIYFIINWYNGVIENETIYIDRFDVFTFDYDNQNIIGNAVIGNDFGEFFSTYCGNESIALPSSKVLYNGTFINDSYVNIMFGNSRNNFTCMITQYSNILTSRLVEYYNNFTEPIYSINERIVKGKDIVHVYTIDYANNNRNYYLSNKIIQQTNQTLAEFTKFGTTLIATHKLFIQYDAQNNLSWIPWNNQYRNATLGNFQNNNKWRIDIRCFTGGTFANCYYSPFFDFFSYFGNYSQGNCNPLTICENNNLYYYDSNCNQNLVYNCQNWGCNANATDCNFGFIGSICINNHTIQTTDSNGLINITNCAFNTTCYNGECLTDSEYYLQITTPKEQFGDWIGNGIGMTRDESLNVIGFLIALIVAIICSILIKTDSGMVFTGSLLGMTLIMTIAGFINILALLVLGVLSALIFGYKLKGS